MATLSLDECVAHATADDEVINLVEQVLDNAQLRADLGTTDDGSERMLSVLENVVYGLNLFLHEITKHLVILVERVSNNGS